MLSLVLVLILSLVGLYHYYLAPPRQPHGVGAVPFWVTLLPLVMDVDQEQVFRRYIAPRLHEKGAVKVFFGGQWNVLVQRPSYVAEVLRQEHLYQKSGNQRKIPYSVLAEFLGSNIISARGEEWRQYRAVIGPGLTTSFEEEPMLERAGQLCAILLALQGSRNPGGVFVQEPLQRYSSANLLHFVLGQPQLARKMMDRDPVSLHQVQLTLKRYLFQPLYMSFPVLDRLSFMIPSRRKARQLVREFAAMLQASVLQGDGLDGSAGNRLVHAWREGLLTDRQFRDNLMVLYVAGQENPQLLMISILYLLAKHPNIQARLRQEIRSSGMAGVPSPDWTRLPYLTATILECLRLFPPISQLINRHVSQPTQLGGHLDLPAGTYVGYHSYATNRDPGAWGVTANDFEPLRWGTTHEQISRTYRHVKARAAFISFHGGARACLGEKFAMLEMRTMLLVLLHRLQWKLAPDWTDRMAPVGDFRRTTASSRLASSVQSVRGAD
ncbi:putative cytochrome P450 oxidoreductase [Aspergillus sclerotiicarbonarius CBS 121057]|uniref:Putative cytochrome P450 oxidoreductase n=1 Tax=Aspergillus sclerotiicarbonarius (strain CBS 121057 / IBT 28362) TaxID=1448318 RepID=A0A319FDV2_ASPSB|nr:putative cytochrome P450 oxidoreductase [Aspergillus sclerotiicarbonarius CBS 121057]